MSKKFSELDRAVSLNNGDLLALAQVDEQAETGYKSAAAPVSDVAQKILKGISFSADLETDSKNVLGAINEAAMDKNLADPYSNQATYAVGDFVIYQTVLYKCTTAVSVAEDFDSTKWTQAKVSEMVGTDVSSEKELTLSPVSILTSCRASKNDNSSDVYLAADNNMKAKAYQVTAGKTYKIRGFGYDRSTFYVAAIGQDLVAVGYSTPIKQLILCGGSAYPTDYTNHVITFTANSNGYLYVNERPSTGVDGYARTNVSIIEKNENCLIVNNGSYKHLAYVGKGNYLLREFTRRGPNNLFQLIHVGLGYLDTDNNYIEIRSFMTATTDIVGPFSIDKVGWSGGQWTGGNHSVTVDNVACPTAEQLSLKIYVGNEEIVDDGIYWGDVRIVANNKLYFAQTITGNTFTGATPAILETRVYNLTKTMNVEVFIELLDDVRFSKYYGMQYVNQNVVSIIVPNDETVVDVSNLSANYQMTNKQPDIILQYAAGEELHMILYSEGLGSYVHNAGTDGYGLITTYGKTYHTLISGEVINTGKKLYWCGEYRFVI